jgi:hypothetical protein
MLSPEETESARAAEAAKAAAEPVPAPRDVAVVQKELADKTKRYFCIYDQLAVLASLKALCYAVRNEGLADRVTECEVSLKSNGELEPARRSAIEALKGHFVGGARAIEAAAGAGATILSILSAAQKKVPGIDDAAADEMERRRLAMRAEFMAANKAAQAAEAEAAAAAAAKRGRAEPKPEDDDAIDEEEDDEDGGEASSKRRRRGGHRTPRRKGLPQLL